MVVADMSNVALDTARVKYSAAKTYTRTRLVI